MADTKLTDLTALEATPAIDDVIYIADISAGSAGSRKIESVWFLRTDGSVALLTGGGTIDLGGYTFAIPGDGTAITSDAVQTLTNKTLGTPSIAGGTIDGAIITGGTVGTVSVEGGTITSPVFAGTADGGVFGTATYVGGTIDTAAINTATIGTPNITGGTADSLTLNNATIGTPNITGGTITGASIEGGSYSLTDGSASLALVTGALSTAGTTEMLAAASVAEAVWYRAIWKQGTVTSTGQTSGEIPFSSSSAQYDSIDNISPYTGTWRIYVGTAGDLYLHGGTALSTQAGTVHLMMYYS